MKRLIFLASMIFCVAPTHAEIFGEHSPQVMKIVKMAADQLPGNDFVLIDTDGPADEAESLLRAYIVRRGIETAQGDNLVSRVMESRQQNRRGFASPEYIDLDRDTGNFCVVALPHQARPNGLPIADRIQQAFPALAGSRIPSDVLELHVSAHEIFHCIDGLRQSRLQALERDLDRGMTLSIHAAELGADIFASLMVRRELGEVSIPALRRLADFRALGIMNNDAEHDTRAGIVTAVEARVESDIVAQTLAIRNRTLADGEHFYEMLALALELNQRWLALLETERPDLVPSAKARLAAQLDLEGKRTLAAERITEQDRRAVRFLILGALIRLGADTRTISAMVVHMGGVA